MSFLTLKKGIPDFSKAVISLWFRAPKESVKKAAKSQVTLEANPAGFTILQGVLPLITFGKPQQNKHYVAKPKIDVGVAVDYKPYIPGFRMRSPGWTSLAPFEVEPCMIGLQCFSNETEEDGEEVGFNVVFNIQTGVEMEFSHTSFVTTRIDDYDNTKVPPPYTGPLGVDGWIDNYSQSFIEDASYRDNDLPAFFYVQSTKNLQPDQWHHVLLSFDVSGEVSVGNPFASSNCKMWYAIDDKDYRGQDHMGPYRGASYGAGSNDDELGDNTIITYKAWRLSGPPSDEKKGFTYDAHVVPAPSGTYAGGLKAIPSGDTGENPPEEEGTSGDTDSPPGKFEMGLPASKKYVDGIFRVEMAEFQMWTGVTLDTERKSNRRAFVDDNGKPVNPTRSPEDADNPDEPPKGPGERLLGKRPEILLHGSGKWKTGYNTGSAGQFVPTAKIERYKPDPSLTETPTA